MNVLLIGSGGREHALAWKIAQSPRLGKLLCVPGNTGTAQHGQNVPLPLNDLDALTDLARREKVDLVVIGPEKPLAEGMADHFTALGIPVFGPSAAAAQIEGSKAFAKEIMAEAMVPTAAAHVFANPNEAADFVRSSGQAWVVKADGLAQGKGVIVTNSIQETIEAINQIKQALPGQSLLLEERLTGREVSVLALCDGRRVTVLPPARDHKRLGDGDTGPNTGGMGVVAPVDDLSPELLDNIVKVCIQPVIDVLAARRTPFCGVLYAGLIFTETGPQVLEYNARFGDPEAQAVLPLVEGDLLEALYSCATGNLQPDQLRQRNGYAVCVVLCAAGYPGNPRKGDTISGVETTDDNKVLIFHAGTALGPNGLCTGGGRVLGVTGQGHTLRQAHDHAYQAVDHIHFDGKHYRNDIGGQSKP
jgi:phosphoribosylamine--glycine ligase